MSREMYVLFESHRAVRALVRLLTGVSSNVRSERVLELERLVADLTAELLLRRVNLHVRLKTGVENETFETDVTLVVLYARVAHHV